eukprot:scaffold214652_cov18-Tisochrysis_lutea.AAC.1
MYQHAPTHSAEYNTRQIPLHTCRSRQSPVNSAAAAGGAEPWGDEGPSTSGPGPVKSQYRALSSLVERLPSIDDTNALQTALTDALVVEEYKMASAIRDRLKEDMCLFQQPRKALSCGSLCMAVSVHKWFKVWALLRGRYLVGCCLGQGADHFDHQCWKNLAEALEILGKRIRATYPSDFVVGSKCLPC